MADPMVWLFLGCIVGLTVGVFVGYVWRDDMERSRMQRESEKNQEQLEIQRYIRNEISVALAKQKQSDVIMPHSKEGSN